MIRDKMPVSEASPKDTGRSLGQRTREGLRRATKPVDMHKQMLEYLYRMLKAQYPGMEEGALRDAAQKLFFQIRQQQQDEFDQKFRPGQVPVAQNEQRPWQYSPAAPGGVEYTDTPEYKAKMDEARRRQIQQEQEAAAKNAPVTRPPNWTPPPPGFRPGQAQPIQPPSQGTPYGATAELPPAGEYGFKPPPSGSANFARMEWWHNPSTGQETQATAGSIAPPGWQKGRLQGSPAGLREWMRPDDMAPPPARPGRYVS